MSRKTYFVVQAFGRGAKGAMIAKPPIEAPGREQADRMAQRLAIADAGALAFSRTGDPTTGDYDDAEIIGIYGAIPDEALEATRAA